MNDVLSLDTDWHLLLKMLPRNWRDLAKSTKAITRKLRNFENEDSILRALLLHVAGGYSLRETSARLKMGKIADVSDVALLKRLQCSEAWLRELCLSLLNERGVTTSQCASSIRMRLVDGTTVKEPGKTGSSWRIHYSFILSNLQCDFFKLTPVKGTETGESLKQYPISKGDCIIGDRGYANPHGIAYVAAQGAYSLVRVNTGTLRFITPEQKQFDLLQEVKKIKKGHESREWNVVLEGKGIAGRLCVIRKTKIATEQAKKKLRQFASRRGKQILPATEEFAGYVIVFTTLPRENYSLESVLGWYRIRWQIELVFKRLKTIIKLGHLPKHDEISARAWLYGKLFTGLLVEKLIACAKSVSPWGYE